MKTIKPVSILCASALFIAVFYLPIAYFTILRIIVFIGAILVIRTIKKQQLHWVAVFTIIAILFNPIFPIYLYVKAFWIPIDIISAVLFLIIAFLKTPEKKVEIKKREERAYTRDKIY